MKLIFLSIIIPYKMSMLQLFLTIINLFLMKKGILGRKLFIINRKVPLKYILIFIYPNRFTFFTSKFTNS